MRNLLKNGAEKMDIRISDEQLDKFVLYAELLREWNKKMNLTAIDDDKGIVQKHFLDSLSAINTGLIGRSVIDIGTGAGFPGLVLKIMMPEARLTLLDSLNKRLTFLKAVSSELGMDDIEFIHGRAEEIWKNPDYFEAYDTAAARAVAKMSVLAEWCIPYVKKGGHFLAMKGPSADEELKEARGEIVRFGGDEGYIFDADIPDTDMNHKIICIKKVRHSPTPPAKKTSSRSKKSAQKGKN